MPTPNESHNTAGNSSTYHSRSNTMLSRLQRLHSQGRIIGVINSPFYPRTVQEYGDHQAKYASDVVAEEKQKLSNNIASAAAINTSVTERGLKGEEKRRQMMKMKVHKLMKPMDFSGQTAVLAKKSIWAPGAEMDGAVDWPAREEMKYEGEQQARQKLPRCFPLPRENRMRDIDRSEMMNGGGEEEVAKMERGEMAILWRMKVIAEVEKFDETKMGWEDRVKKGLEPSEKRKKKKDHVQDISDQEAREKGRLGKDLLDEL